MMFQLNARVCDSLMLGGVRPYAFSPFPLLVAAGRKGTTWLNGLLDSDLTPVTFGDVVREDDGFRIISGDTIVRMLCRSLRPAGCIFVTDVDGILDDAGAVMPTIDRSDVKRLSREASSDATGGIAFKASEALRIAAAGTEVAFVSGFRPREFSKALKRLRHHGTLVRVPSRV
jgi:isopentenyl phosphate kinase